MADSNPAIDAIRSIAVDPEEVLDAFVYTRENPGTAVLRVTPPFHGRMRARLHVFRDAPGADTAYCRPADLLADEVVAAYPTLDDVVDGSDDPGTDPEERRVSRARAVEDWRERAADAIVDGAVLERGEDRIRVGVSVLG